MGLTIRTITEDEFVAWQDVMSSAFFSPRDVAAAAEWKRPYVDLNRCWAALDGDQVAASLRTLDNELTVPGGVQLPVDAVTNVAVRSTHRRRGALTGMMTASLAAAAERGDAVSILIAARWPIYGRFGFGPAIEGAAYSIDNRLASFRPEVSSSGSLRYVDVATARATVDGIFARFRAAQVGAIQRQPELTDIDFNLATAPGLEPWKGWTVLHEDATGKPDGWLRYHVEDKWDGMEPEVTLHVDDLVAATEYAYVSLWRLCCEMDNVRWVKAVDRSVEEPLPWLMSDGRAVTQNHRSDFVWLRLLDVAAALSARTYAVEGRLTVEVTDPLGHAAGRFALDGGPDGAKCTRTEASPDLSLPAYALGAAYLGGTRLRTLARAGYVSEQTRGTLALADLMLSSSPAPWCNTWF